MPGCDPVQPDVLVVRNEDLGVIWTRIEGVPALLVEVLSPGNVSADTEIKRRAYARAGVPEYWIVRPAQRDVLCPYPQLPLTSAPSPVCLVPGGGWLVTPAEGALPCRPHLKRTGVSALTQACREKPTPM
jgi:Uma2 family endonuclease